MHLGFFDPRGGDLLTVVDGVSCAERDAAAGSGFLGAGFTEEVVCAGFVANGDCVTVCEGECDGAAACGGFRDCGSGEHAGERLCRLIVSVSVHGVHGVCFLFCVGVWFYCSTQACVLSTRVGVDVGTHPPVWDRPGSCLAGAAFRVDASHACAGAMRACLASGARRVGFDVRAGGVNGDLAARETEVRGL